MDGTSSASFDSPLPSHRREESADSRLLCYSNETEEDDEVAQVTHQLVNEAKSEGTSYRYTPHPHDERDSHSSGRDDAIQRIETFSHHGSSGREESDDEETTPFGGQLQLVELGSTERPGSNRLSFPRRASSYVSDFGSIWDDMDGRRVFRGHDAAVSAVAVFIGKNYPLIISGDENHVINVWSLHFSEPLAHCVGHSAKISSLITMHEDHCEPVIISGSWDESIRIWALNNILTADYDLREICSTDLEASTVIDNLKSRVLSLATLCLNGHAAVAVGTAGRTIHIYSLPEGDLKYSIHDPDHMNWNLCIRGYMLPEGFGMNSDHELSGPVIASGCKNNCVRIWSLPVEIIFPSTAQQKLDEVKPVGSISALQETLGFVKPENDAIGKAGQGEYTPSISSADDSRMWSQSRAIQRMLRADVDTSDAGSDKRGILMQRSRSTQQSSRLPRFRSSAPDPSDPYDHSASKMKTQVAGGRYGYKNYSRGSSFSGTISATALLQRSKSDASVAVPIISRERSKKDVTTIDKSSTIVRRAGIAASEENKQFDDSVTKQQGQIKKKRSFFGLKVSEEKESANAPTSTEVGVSSLGSASVELEGSSKKYGIGFFYSPKDNVSSKRMKHGGSQSQMNSSSDSMESAHQPPLTSSSRAAGANKSGSTKSAKAPPRWSKVKNRFPTAGHLSDQDQRHGLGSGDFFGKAYSRLNKRKVKHADFLHDEPIRSLPHPSRVQCVVIYRSDDDVYIASICKDSAIRIWSFEGELLKLIHGQNSPLSWLAAYDAGADEGSGGILVSGTVHGDIRVWYHSTGELLKVFHGHGDEVTALTVFLKDSIRSNSNSMSDPDLNRQLRKSKKISNKQSELFIVSASKDKTIRTWKVSNEKSLKVLQHPPGVCVTCMTVYTGSEVIVVSGADDGKVRGWLLPSSSNYDLDDTMIWCTDAHHNQRVQAIALYAPHNSGGSDTNSIVREQMDPLAGDHLEEAFIVCTGEDGAMMLISVADGEVLVELPIDSNGPLSSLIVYSGPMFMMDPILVTGSEDSLVRIYSLVNFERLFILDGHDFGVTALTVYAPQTENFGGAIRSRKSNSSFGGKGSGKNMFFEEGDSGMQHHAAGTKLFSPNDVIIISGSIDNTVRLWQQTTGDNVGAMECPGHITCLAAIDLPKNPILVAGDSEGEFHIWSMHSPFLFLRTLQSYAQDVEVVAMCDLEGRYPVMVGGHLDGSVSVWNLSTYEAVTLLEGHSSQVTALQIFSRGGSVSAVASASSDGCIRIVFDFLDVVPDAAKIMQLFNADMSGEASYLTSQRGTNNTRWPRMNEAVQKIGAEEFFNIYYYLFKHAVRSARPDFLDEFLPRSRAGLINSHNATLVGHGKTLLDIAMSVNSAKAVRIIVNCWANVFSNPPVNDQDIVYQVNFEDLNETMLVLADLYPLDFEKLICAVQPIRVRYNSVPPFKNFLYFHKRIRKMRMAIVPETGALESDEFFFYPVPYFATGQTLMAFESVCKTLDSVEIFKSEAGKMVLLYAWNNFGRTAHFYSMLLYTGFVMAASCELLLFAKLRHEFPGIIYALMAYELAYDLFSVYEEVYQLDRDFIWYFLHVWNAIDVSVVCGNVTGITLRLVYWEETIASRIVLSITIVLAWFNLLQFLRAYESTGPLVSMILKTAADIQYLMFVLLIFLLGFSLAFWILSTNSEETVFGRFDQGLLYAFSFMLGEYDVTVFDGAALQGFMAAMSVLYMLIVAILLLNLLIALMGNSYSNVQTKGVAQSRLERAKICVDMEPSSFAPRPVLNGRYAKMNEVLYVRRGEDEEDSLRGHFRTNQTIADESLALLKTLIANQDEMKTTQSQMKSELLAVRTEVTELRVQNRMLQEALNESNSVSASQSSGDFNESPEVSPRCDDFHTMRTVYEEDEGIGSDNGSESDERQAFAVYSVVANAKHSQGTAVHYSPVGKRHQPNFDDVHDQYFASEVAVANDGAVTCSQEVEAEDSD